MPKKQTKVLKTTTKVQAALIHPCYSSQNTMSRCNQARVNIKKQPTKLCNYIAADRTNYQYVCYEAFQIAGWKESYAIKNIGNIYNYLLSKIDFS